jgi:hypothetical protein
MGQSYLHTHKSAYASKTQRGGDVRPNTPAPTEILCNTELGLGFAGSPECLARSLRRYPCPALDLTY